MPNKFSMDRFACPSTPTHITQSFYTNLAERRAKIVRMAKNRAAVTLGRLGGQAGTAAQNEARRQNGKKGAEKQKRTLRQIRLDKLSAEP